MRRAELRVFAALPSDASLVARFTLLAQGGSLVSSEREGGDIKYVGIKSQNGRSVTLINQAVQHARVRAHHG